MDNFSCSCRFYGKICNYLLLPARLKTIAGKSFSEMILNERFSTLTILEQPGISNFHILRCLILDEKCGSFLQVKLEFQLRVLLRLLGGGRTLTSLIVITKLENN